MGSIALFWFTRPTLAAWWPGTEGNHSWLKRNQLTLTNSNTSESLAVGTTVAITVNTKNLVSQGKLQPSCNDLRIVYQNGSNYTELDRFISFPGGSNCADSEASKVYFPIYSNALDADESDSNYYLYYANPQASAPANPDNAFDIGSADALLICPFDGTTTCAAGETNQAGTPGAIRYSGAKTAIQFTGVDYDNDVLNAGSDTSIDNLYLKGATMEFWVYLNSYGNQQNGQIITNKGVVLYSDIQYHRFNVWAVGFDTTAGRWNTPNDSIPLHQWTHVAFIYDSSSVANDPTVYINGLSQTITESVTPEGTYDDSLEDLEIGSNGTNGNSPMDGIIDELRFSDTVRYSANFTPSTTPFVRDSYTKLLYHFDENGQSPDGNLAYDDSGLGNHGTITGAKFVSGLIGIDNPDYQLPAASSQSFSGHEGVFIEEGTTNKIPDPSFENTFPPQNSWETTLPGCSWLNNDNASYYKFGSQSINLSADSTGNCNVIDYINGGGVENTLSAYVYRGSDGHESDTVDNTVAQLIFDGTAQSTTTYTDTGRGWWRLSYTNTSSSSSTSYGVLLTEDSGSIYIDGVQLEAKPYATTYTDGSLGTGYAWDTPSQPNNSSSTRQDGNIEYDPSGNINQSTGSVSFWVKAPSIIDANTTFFESAKGSPFRGIEVLKASGAEHLKMFYYDGTTQELNSGIAMEANKWYHLVGTWDDSNLEFYVNGTSEANDNTFTQITDAFTDFYIGNNNGAGYANATISDFRIFDDALTSTQIADMYYSGLVSHSDQYEVDAFSADKGQNPVAIWHFDEGYGSTAHDSSIYGNDLAATGASWDTQNTGNNTARNRTLSFDGSGDYLSRTWDKEFDFGTGSFTISGWFRHDSTNPSGTQVILSHTGSGNPGYQIYMNTGGEVCLGIDDDSSWGPDDETCSENSLADSAWHFFEAVKDSTVSLQIYIDGYPSGSNLSLSATSSVSSRNSTYIGADYTLGNNWEGRLDEIIVYPYARTSDQIKTDYSGGASAIGAGSAQNNPVSAGLIGYWQMDNTGTGAVDSSGNGQNLTGIGIPSKTTGKYGSGADLESSGSQFFYTDDNAVLSVTGSFTLSGWIRPESNSAATQYTIAAKWESGQESYLLAQYGDEIRLYLDSASDYITTTDTNLSTSIWYYVSTVYDSVSRTAKIYVNGILQSSTITGTVPSSLSDDSSKFTIGADSSSVSSSGTDIGPLQPGDDSTEEQDWEIDGTAWNKDGESSNQLYTGWYSNHHNWGGVRFTLDQAIPAGSTVNTASFQVYSQGNWQWGTDDYLRIYVSDSSDAPASTGGGNRPSIGTPSGGDVTVYPTSINSGTRWPVSGDLSWPASGNWATSTDISSLIQHLVDTHNGLASGAHIVIWFVEPEQNGGTDSEVAWLDREAGLTNSAKLSLNISSPTGSGSNYYDGRIDELRLYNRALIPSEINTLYNWAPGPVGYWNMDENSGTVLNDSSGNGNNGIISNSAWSQGKFGSGLAATTIAQDIVTVSDPSSGLLDLDNTRSFTLNTWVKGTETDGPIFILTKNFSGGAASPGYGIGVTDAGSAGNAACSYSDGLGGTVEDNVSQGGNGVAADGQWHYVTCLMDRDGSSMGTAGMYLFVDGEKVDSDTTLTEGSAANSSDLTFLENATGDMTGSIDEVKIYNYARTPAQIVQDMNAGHPAPGSPVGSPLGYWNFDEGYGNIIHNSGNTDQDLDGLISTASMWTMGGKFGRGLSFNGTSQRTADNIYGATDIRTVSLWVKPSTNTQPLINLDESNHYITSSSGLITAIGFSDPVYYVNGVISRTLTAGIWQHIVVTTETGISSGDGIMMMIGSANGSYLNGFMDEVKLYNSVLTADQVKAEFNQGKSLVIGATGTDASNTPSYNAVDSYCPPGQGSVCTPPITEWKFDEGNGSTAYDISNSETVNDNYLDLASGTAKPAWVSGKIGWALSFDGVNDRAVTHTTIPLSSTNVITVEFWLNWDTYANDGDPALGMDACWANSGCFTITPNDSSGNFKVATYESGNWNSAEFTRPSAGNWHYYSIVMDNGAAAANEITPYVDGRPVSYTKANSDNHTGNFADSFISFMGFLTDSAYGKGKMDQVRIYNYARTPAQIAWDYNHGAPIAHWRLDECSGTSVHDTAPKPNKSDTGYTGTIVPGASGNTSAGSCESGVSTEMWNNGTTGKYSASLDFDGGNDAVTIPLVTDSTDNFTVAAWVKWAGGDSSDQFIFFNGYNENPYNGWGVQVDTSDSDRLAILCNASGMVSTNTLLTQGQWQHLTIVKNNNWYLYLDGKQITTTGTCTVTTPTVNTLIGNIVGSGVSGDGFNGQIDDVRIYNYPLTSDQVKLLYNNASAVKF